MVSMIRILDVMNAERNRDIPPHNQGLLLAKSDF